MIAASRRKQVVDGQLVRVPRRLAGSGGEPVSNPIEAALAPQVSRETVRAAVLEIAEQIVDREAAYAGGLAAEKQSAKQFRDAAKARMRAAVFAGRGRRIDLAALLRQANADGDPIWAVVDPAMPISRYDRARNGYLDRMSDGTKVHVGGKVALTLTGNRAKNDLLPAGLPPLPAAARKIATDPKVRKHAVWVGVLYQPEEWVKVNPDPAVVVEWKDRPGEYFALCVWGGDRAAIMEFVD
jgi:hypothetical protein